MSPYELEILLHHYITPVPFPRNQAPAYEPTLNGMQKAGVIDRTDDTESGIAVTDLGRAWLTAILSTPIPQIKYTLAPIGKEITLEDDKHLPTNSIFS